jgi:glycosidase
MKVEHLLPTKPQGKPVVYQVFTRLFGNTNTTNKPWGTIDDNGVGKFSDFTDTALQGIKELGNTHIWYTGVPHHDVTATQLETLKLTSGGYLGVDLLTGTEHSLIVEEAFGVMELSLEPMQSVVIQL